MVQTKIKQTFIDGPKAQEVQFEVGDGGGVKGCGRTQHYGWRWLVVTKVINKTNLKVIVP